MRIIGRPVPTPMPRADLGQKDPRHASYVFGKEEFLDQGVNEALAKAKASGEFDGKDGKDGYTPVKGKDYFDGKDGLDGDDGDDGFSPVVSVATIEGGHRVTITDKYGTQSFDVMDGENVEGGGGSRGTGIFKVTTAPSGYTTTVGGFKPTYRMSLSTALSQSRVTEILVGDIIENSYYHYPVGYVDASYVYMGARTSIRGATGGTGATGKAGADGYTPVKGTDYWTETDKAEMVEDVIAALPTWEGGSY